jgi:hypothetical protein
LFVFYTEYNGNKRTRNKIKDGTKTEKTITKISSVDIAVILLAARPRRRGLIPDRGKRYIFLFSRKSKSPL